MIRVLVVEDDADVAAVHVGYLGRLAGFACAGVAHRVTEALERVRAGGVDLVLLDFHLPDGRGLDLCRALRAERRPVDVIAITAARDVESVREAVSQGVVGYLIKPFAFEAFEDRLERYAAYRHRLASRTEADQPMVDALLGTLRSSDPDALPKGLTRPTLQRVAAELRAHAEPRSAAEVGAALGVARVTARRYLDHLVAEGLAELSLRHGAGRPEHRYGPPGGRGA